MDLSNLTEICKDPDQWEELRGKVHKRVDEILKWDKTRPAELEKFLLELESPEIESFINNLHADQYISVQPWKSTLNALNHINSYLSLGA